MKHLTPQIISEITRGEYIGNESARNIRVAGAVRDNRDVQPGNLFVCIRGARVDGHSFANGAFESGAACCLAERIIPEARGPYVLVESTLEAIKQLGAYHRRLFTAPVIGVTGSVGKTTAKELIAAALGAKLRVLKTPMNLNNELGVPLTLLSLDERHEAAVIEMGISDFGEMGRLAQMVRPDVFIITKIGHSHIEELGDLNGVLRAKTEALAYMAPDGVVILNGDDEILREYDIPLLREDNMPLSREYDKQLLREDNSPLSREYDTPLLREDNMPLLREDNMPLRRKYDMPLRRKYDTPLRRKYDALLLREDNTPLRRKYDMPLRRKFDTPLRWKYDTPLRKITFGTGENNDYRAVDIRAEGTDAVLCDIESDTGRFAVRIPAYGSHLAALAACAAAVGRLLGATDEEITRGLLSYMPVGGRSNIKDTGIITLIDDCYNANPHSMEAALTSLSTLAGRHVAILGDMIGLGAMSDKLHRETGEFAAICGADCFICCGEKARIMFDSYRAVGGNGAYYYPVKADLITALPGLLKHGDNVLVKASHAMQFEEITGFLQDLHLD